MEGARPVGPGSTRARSGALPKPEGAVLALSGDDPSRESKQGRMAADAA